MKLIATKAMTYAMRRLKAGAPFVARTAAHARVLVAAKKAKFATVEEQEPPLDDIDVLRAEYQGVIGRRPYHGWDAATLIQKIAEERAKA